MSCYQQSRRGEGWTFAEFVMIALAYRDGDAVSEIARRLRRPIPAVRALLVGSGA